ncbi:cyclase family protein [Naasia sp. SYSU D00948]|uniref:cyclase family protein n=1 Tax=Naasia sp. SYSU D00948 TaxID=2817379 RepID=UPI0027DAFDDA|nr:cyclase family protein [Naasia sp. SYSU D00948]
MTEYRAVFDASVRFANGGGMTAEGFRLDLPSPDLSEDEVEMLFVRHLGLAMVADVALHGLRIVEEQHKGSRSVLAAQPVSAASPLVDLSHAIREGLVTYPGLPAPTITPHLTREASRERYAEGTEFGIDTITMVGNTGTYLDSPFHRYADGADLAALTLDQLVGLRAEVFRLTDAEDRGIPAAVFADRELRGAAVLLHTGWDRHFGSEQYGAPAPFLTEEGARFLVEQGVALVGIDSVNIDDTSPDARGARPAHSLLLRAGIPIVEHLTNLDQVPPSGATFTAVPPKVERFGTFPVRAFAVLP